MRWMRFWPRRCSMGMTGTSLTVSSVPLLSYVTPYVKLVPFRRR